MQLKSILALTVIISSVSAGRSLRAACGSSEVVKTATFPYKNKILKMTETFCPGFAALGNTTHSRELVERQGIGASCSNGGCTVDCAATGEQPFISDCDELTDALEALYPQTFPVPAGSFQAWTLGTTCAYGFGNLDTVPYSVCYLNFGFNGAITAEDCFGDWPAPQATAGGYCFSPGTPDDNWGIEVFFPSE